MKEIIWINGRVVRKKDAVVSIFDHGFLYGDGLFETMRAYKGKIFRVDQHMARLFASAKVLKIKIPYSKIFLKKAVSELVKGLKSKGAYIRIAITRGEGEIGLDPRVCKRPNVIMFLKSFEGYPESYYKKGAKVIISSARCNHPSPLSHIKSNNYLNNILSFIEAKKKGKDDAIMLNTDGFATEATTSNVFIVKKEEIITPMLSQGLLPGITREAIIELAHTSGFTVLEKKLSVSELKNADEVFLTNSIVELRGVVEIDGVKISKAKIGPITRLLHRLYRQLVLLIFLFFITCVENTFACPIEGPNMPNNKFWKTGVQTNIIIDKDMKKPKGELESNQFFLTSSFGITDWLCFDGKVGVGDITFDIADSQEIEYSTNFAGGYGGRILLYKDVESNLNCILGLHHISVHPNSEKKNGIKYEAILDEWQGSLLVSKKIKNFRPYIAGKLSKVYLKRKVDDVRTSVRPEDYWGLVIGLDIDVNKNARFNIEGRCFDEDSLTFGFNYSF